MTYRTATIKRNLELIIMFPFVLLGRIAGHIFPLKGDHNVFLFFPSADIGGAIRVNADITDCIKDLKPIIIFSKKPKNNGFHQLFEMEGVRSIDLHKYIDNKLFHFVNFFFRGVLAAWINKRKNPVAFGGEGLFFYKVIPHLKKECTTIELCHLNTWFNFTQAFIPYIDHRIFSTPKIKRDAEKQFTSNGIPVKYASRLQFIDNKIAIPPYLKTNNDVLEVIFVGRGAPQKRIHLLAAIAKELHEKKLPVHFSFVGDVEHLVSEDVKAYCTLYGNIRDEKRMNAIYQQSDVLILTSAYEGLPIVVMEMMARGKVVVSTAVDGIPDYIRHDQNGLLIRSTDEKQIVEEGVGFLRMLAEDSKLRDRIGAVSYQYASGHFSGEKFCAAYRELFEGT